MVEEPITEPIGPPPERRWWLWLVLLLVVVIGGLLLWFFLSRGPGKTIVPNVIGMRSDAAALRLHRAHLKDLPVPSPSTQPQGVVFAQRPGPGSQVNKNQTVTISVSTGPARVTVPNVTGLTVADATAKLAQKSFKSQVVLHASTRPNGFVFAQQPLAGVTAVKGTTVILSVSTGVKPVTVPSVVGETQGAAVTQLTNLGLKPKLQNVPSTRPVGQVVAQKPPAATNVDKGSTVILNVSTGTGPSTTTVSTTTTTATTVTAGSVTVPHVVGLLQNRAIHRIVGAGLRPTIVYVASTRPVNLVVSQVPASGTRPSGSRVRINVAEGANPQAAKVVPDVTGQDPATATQTLRAAGFRVYVVRIPTADQTQDGIVVDEQPRPGSRIPGGLQVTIFVGRFTG